MFRDLKEYQEITKIYQDSVHIPEEERIITQILQAENFTQEELDYIIENFDEVYDNQILTEEFFDEMEGEYLEEMAPVKKAAEMVGKKILPGAKKVVQKGVKQLNVFKDTAKNVKPVVKKSVQKVGETSKKVVDGGVGVPKTQTKNIIQKGKEIGQSAVTKLKSGIKNIASNPTVQKVAKTATKIVPGLALAGGLAVGAKKLLDKKKSDNIKKQVDDYVEKRKNPDGIRKIDAKQFDSRGRKPTETKVTEKPKKMHSIEKKNRARFGDSHVDKLKAKNADFKLMRKGTMSKDDFIKKYPKSITAQKAAGLRDHTEWDAYDMVLEYLFSTEQVASLEEANYVMMEMEQQTIGEIVKEVKVVLDEMGIEGLIPKDAFSEKPKKKPQPEYRTPSKAGNEVLIPKGSFERRKEYRKPTGNSKIEEKVKTDYSEYPELVAKGRGGKSANVDVEPKVLKTYRGARELSQLLPTVAKGFMPGSGGVKKQAEIQDKKNRERYKNPKGLERVMTGFADKLTKDKYDFDKKGPSK